MISKLNLLSYFLLLTLPVTFITGPAIPDISITLIGLLFLFSFFCDKKIFSLKNNKFFQYTIFFLHFLLIISFFAWIIYYQSLSDVYLVTVTRMSTPLFFFILAFPFIKLQYRWLVILLSIICIISDLAWRANVSRILVCWIIVLFYYLLLDHILQQTLSDLSNIVFL